MSDNIENTETGGKVINLAKHRTPAGKNQQEGRSLSAIFQRVGQLIDAFDIQQYIEDDVVAREISLLDLSDKIVNELFLGDDEDRDEFQILINQNLSDGFNDHSFPYRVDQQSKFIKNKRANVTSTLCSVLHHKMGGG